MTTDFEETTAFSDVEVEGTRAVPDVELAAGKGMLDSLAKKKIRTNVFMTILMKSLLPEYAGYNSAELLQLTAAGMTTQQAGELQPIITFGSEEPNVSDHINSRLDVLAAISGIPPKFKEYSIDNRVLTRFPGMTTGMQIHVDIEPQSKTMQPNEYLKRCKSYLAQMRIDSKVNPQQKVYGSAQKLYTIWLTNESVSFAHTTGVYHSIVVGGDLNIDSREISNLADLNLEEIFIVSIPDILRLYHNNKNDLVYLGCKHLQGELTTSELNHLGALLGANITYKEGTLMSIVYKTQLEWEREESEAKGEAKGKVEGEAKGKTEGKIESAIKTAREMKNMEINLDAILEIFKKSMPEVFEQVKPEILKLFEEQK